MSPKRLSSSHLIRRCQLLLRNLILDKAQSIKVSHAFAFFVAFYRVLIVSPPSILAHFSLVTDPDFLAFQTALTAPPDPADTPAEPRKLSYCSRDSKESPLTRSSS